MTLDEVVADAATDLVSLLEQSAGMAREGMLTTEEASQLLGLVKHTAHRLGTFLDRVDGPVRVAR